MNRKWIMTAIATATIGLTPLVSSAQIYVDIAPPAPRHEYVPAPREGYVWAPGHYVWRNGEYRWVKGRYIREVRGRYYHPAHWVERNGRWVYVEGRWRNDRYAYNDRHYGYARGPYGDRDRDGIPNRYDRDRDNDGVPNRYDRDRDNDGVPNRYDSAPNNPNYR